MPPMQVLIIGGVLLRVAGPVSCSPLLMFLTPLNLKALLSALVLMSGIRKVLRVVVQTTAKLITPYTLVLASGRLISTQVLLTT